MPTCASIEDYRAVHARDVSSREACSLSGLHRLPRVRLTEGLKPARLPSEIEVGRAGPNKLQRLHRRGEFPFNNADVG